MDSKEGARIAILDLVHNYLSNIERFRGQSEEDTRVKFIDRLFQALGWDVFGDKIPDEVEREQPVKTKESGKKKADYTFKINGITRLIVEAKAQGENLDNEVYVRQVETYAYNRVCPWAVLTNFNTIRIFRVDIDGAVPFYRIDLADEKEFGANFDLLWYLSRDSVKNKLLEAEAKRRGISIQKVPIDKKLLTDLRTWRQLLTNDIKKRYRDEYDSNSIDELVQRIIDRLIFVRKVEDCQLEEPALEQIIRRVNKDTYQEIKKVFDIYRRNYNSGLFGENDKPSHDSDRIELTNEIIEKIVGQMHRPTGARVEYDFSAIDADILGSIYEQYLAYVASQTTRNVTLKGGIAHRKEQGIYYTPTYIVTYIVKNTLGMILAERRTKELTSLRILDPACGSGSFLIKAYDILNEYLLKHDRDYAQTRFDTTEGLHYSKKVEILQNNIFGVDLDPKAIEITQLNLLMKIAERSHRLPILRKNIKCGNSLIDDNRIDQERAFAWKEQFQEIFADGGFDVIVGNPPYGIIFDETQKRYFEERFYAFRRNNDQFVAFIQRAIELLSPGGIFSFIVPNTFLIGPYFNALKEFILKETRILKIVDLSTNQVFKDPNVFNAIIILQKEENESTREKNAFPFLTVPPLEGGDLADFEELSVGVIVKQSDLHNLVWKPKNSIIDKMNKVRDDNLGNLCYVKDVGFNYWSVGRGKKRGGSIGSKVLYEGKRASPKDISFLKGRDITKYGYVFGGHWLRHDFAKYLDPKVDVFRYSPEFLELSPKIVYRQTADRIIAAMDTNKYYLDKTVHLIVPKPNIKLNLHYLLGILNSKLMTYYYRDMVREEGRTFAQVKTIYIKRIPLRFDPKIESEITNLVQRRLELTSELLGFGEKHVMQRDRLEEQIRSIDDEIDQSTYRVYSLTREQVELVESQVK